MPAPESAAAVTAGPVYLALGDFFIKPSQASVAADQVELVAKKVGSVEHEVVVLKTGRAPDALLGIAPGQRVILVAFPGGSMVNEEAAGQVIGKRQGIGVGETKRGTFQLSPGKYVLFCNIHGHYQQGMTAGFEVK
jgi:uncharacterized cupredoxin-like copper-binding protein